MVTDGPFGKASPAWYQRLSTMAWKETLRTFNPGSLFVVSGVAMVGLAIVNEWVVDKLGTGLSRIGSGSNTSKELYTQRTMPKYKPDFILRWEKEYGSKQQ